MGLEDGFEECLCAGGRGIFPGDNKELGSCFVLSRLLLSSPKTTMKGILSLETK